MMKTMRMRMVSDMEGLLWGKVMKKRRNRGKLRSEQQNMAKQNNTCMIFLYKYILSYKYNTLKNYPITCSLFLIILRCMKFIYRRKTITLLMPSLKMFYFT